MKNKEVYTPKKVAEMIDIIYLTARRGDENLIFTNFRDHIPRNVRRGIGRTMTKEIMEFQHKYRHKSLF